MTEIPQKEKKVEVITANSNPRIKELNKLNKDAKLRKDRDMFVVEGIRMFRELPLQNVQEVYLSESALKEYRGSILLICHEPEFYQDVVNEVWDMSKWTTKIF